MKKVLIVTSVSGFVPQFEMNNVRILQEMGYEVHYAANYNMVGYGTDNHRLDHTGIIRHQVDFTRSPYNIKRNKEVYRQLKNLMEKENFTLLHCHTPVASVLARIAAGQYRKNGMKVMYTAHGFHFFHGAPWKYWCLFYPTECILAHMTDVLITINKEDYFCAKRFCRYTNTKVKYIPGVGIDLNFWSGKDLKPGEREAIRKEVRENFGLEEDTAGLISVGELIPRKNHEEVIRALVKQKKQGKKFHYFICGHGELQEYLQNLILELKLSNEVTLLGYCDSKQVRNYLYGMDVFVFPSKQEGLPVALMEALATGIAVRASNVRGNRELIENKEKMSKYDMHVVRKKMEEIYAEVISY